jgi:hypothetical protein
MCGLVTLRIRTSVEFPLAVDGIVPFDRHAESLSCVSRHGQDMFGDHEELLSCLTIRFCATLGSLTLAGFLWTCQVDLCKVREKYGFGW